MKLLLDAHLPRRLARLLTAVGHDAIHTLDLPARNRTSDEDILRIADRDKRIVVTKDADFVRSFYVTGKPSKLLLISTGNITNAEIVALISSALPAVTSAFDVSEFVELSRGGLIVHR